MQLYLPHNYPHNNDEAHRCPRETECGGRIAIVGVANRTVFDDVGLLGDRFVLGIVALLDVVQLAAANGRLTLFLWIRKVNNKPTNQAKNKTYRQCQRSSGKPSEWLDGCFCNNPTRTQPSASWSLRCPSHSAYRRCMSDTRGFYIITHNTSNNFNII